MSEVVENQDVDVAQNDDSAFAAGFNEARGDEPPADELAAAPEPQASEDAPETPAAEEPAPQQTLIAGLTEEQVKALLLKAGEVDTLAERIEKSFGKFGELNRTIQQLQQQRSGGQLSAASLKRLSEEFPEMAEMLASDLNEALSGTGGAGQPAFDPDQFDQVLSARVADIKIGLEREMEKRLLKREHRDWETVVTSDDFKLWRANVLPAEESERLGNSWDSEFIADKLTEFKAWKGKAAASKENKQKRLEAAVTPRGDAGGPPTLNDDEAFLAGFKNARGAA